MNPFLHGFLLTLTLQGVIAVLLPSVTPTRRAWGALLLVVLYVLIRFGGVA